MRPGTAVVGALRAGPFDPHLGDDVTDGRKAGLQTLISFVGRRAAMFAGKDARDVSGLVRRTLDPDCLPPAPTAPAGFAAQRARTRPGALVMPPPRLAARTSSRTAHRKGVALRRWPYLLRPAFGQLAGGVFDLRQRPLDTGLPPRGRAVVPACGIGTDVGCEGAQVKPPGHGGFDRMCPCGHRAPTSHERPRASKVQQRGR